AAFSSLIGIPTKLFGSDHQTIFGGSGGNQVSFLLYPTVDSSSSSFQSAAPFVVPLFWHDDVGNCVIFVF
ncbi:hypothetical protein LINPERHAP1_LOCUS34060, partial [Linum perenne]